MSGLWDDFCLFEGFDMSWSKYTYPGGAVWKINYRNVANVINAYAYMVALSENAKIEVRSSYPGFSMEGTGVRQSNVLQHDEIIVKSRAKSIAQEMYRAFVAMLTSVDFRRDPVKFLASMRVKTLRLRSEHGGLVEKSNELNRRFLARAESAVSNAIAARDGSILILTVIASVASGGTAAAAATLATGGSALAKYQDTGNAGEAVKAGTGTLIMLGWGQLANVTKGMEAGQKAIFFTLGATVDLSVNVALNSSDKELGEAVETAVWATLRNAAFFWLDAGMQKVLAKETGLMAQENSKQILRTIYQGTGRLFEKAILDDLAKKQQDGGSGGPRPGKVSHGAEKVFQTPSAGALRFVKTHCMYRVS